MTEHQAELKAELLAELQAELQDPKEQLPTKQASDVEDDRSATSTSSQTSASDIVNDENKETPNNETAVPTDKKPQEKTGNDTSKELQAEEDGEPTKSRPAQVDEPKTDQPIQDSPEKKEVVIAVPEAAEAAEETAKASETPPNSSTIPSSQSRPAEPPASTVPIVASLTSTSTTSSSGSDQESKAIEYSPKELDKVTEAKPVEIIQSPKSSRMSSVFSPVIAKLRMDSIMTPTSNSSRRSTVYSSPSTLRKTSQALSGLLPLSKSNSQPKIEERERLSMVTDQTPSVEEPNIKVVELVQIPSSTTVIDFVPDQPKVPEKQQRLSVATSGRGSVNDEPRSKVPSISGQTLAPETSVEPIILKKVNTDQASAPSTSASPNPLMDIVKSLRQPRKRDRLRNRAFSRWVLAIVFGRTIAKRLKAMLELAAGH